MMSFVRVAAPIGAMLILEGCGLLNSKSDHAEADRTDRLTIAALNENGLNLEAYDSSLWGFILDTRSVDGSMSLPTANQASVESPAAVLPGESKDELISDDAHTVFDAPASLYRYIAVRKCLRLTSIIEGGLTANGIYCLQVPKPLSAQCEDPRRLIRSDQVRADLNKLTSENLDLANVLTTKLGFKYDAPARQWSKEAEGIKIVLNPLRLAALSLEGRCDGQGKGSGAPGDNGVAQDDPDQTRPGRSPPSGNNTDDPKGLIHSRLELSSRLAIPMKIAVDRANRTYVPSASAGTADKYSMRIGRFLPDNAPDPAFGAGGYVELPQLLENSAGYVVKVDEVAKRIYVSGYQAGERGHVIVALDESGVLDQAWGAGGVVKFNGSSFQFELDEQGRVIVMTYEGFRRLDLSGQIDATFAQGGVRLLDVQSAGVSTPAFAIRGDDFYVVVQQSDRNAVSVASGKFAETAIKVTKIDGLPGDDIQSCQIAASDGLVVVYGRKIGAGGSDGFLVAALERDGSLKTGFGNRGLVRMDSGSSQNDVVFDTPKTFWMAGWNGALRHFDESGQAVKNLTSTRVPLIADALAMASDGSLVGAYVAHGGGELFRAAPAFLGSLK